MRPDGGQRLDGALLAVLLQAIAQEDRSAFETFYQLTSPRFLALARGLARSANLAEDALQDFYVAIWQRAGSYRPERGAAFPWLLAVLRNRIEDLRRRRRLDTVPLEEAETIVAEMRSPLREAELSEAGRHMAQALAAMPPNMRRAVTLAYFHDADYGEVATAIGVPVNTVKSWVRRALVRLRRDLPA